MLGKKVLFFLLVVLLFVRTSANEQKYQSSERNQPTLTVKNNKAIVVRNGIRVLTIPLEPKKHMAGRVIEDRAFLVANCLIVARRAVSTEGIDSHPRPASVEIFTLNGKRQTYPGSEKYDFLGYTFTHRSGGWGVILHEGKGAEGEISSYLFLKSDGTFKKHDLNAMLLLPREKIIPQISNESDLVIPRMRRGDKLVSLVVKQDGTFVIK